MLNTLLTSVRWQIAAIAIAAFALYYPTLSYDFIGLDEESLLVEKKEFNSKLSNIPNAFVQHVFEVKGRMTSSTAKRFYRPVLTVSFILDQQFSGNSYTFFRFTNITIHLLSAIGLLFLLGRLGVTPALSFLLALLFSLHPLLLQAVAWIPGRNDSLACAFILWSMYNLTTSKSRHGKFKPWIHLLLFSVALFTKENSIVFVGLCGYYVLVMKKELFSQNDKLILFSSYVLISIVWLFARNSAIGELHSSFTNIEGRSGALVLLLQYFQKTLLPVNLSVMSTVRDTHYGWVLLALGIFGAALYYTKHIAWKETIFGLIWFFLFFLPTLLFSYFEGMEHRTYLPMAGLFIAFAFTEPVQRLATDTKRLIAAGGTAALVLFAISFTRLDAFRSELNYWEDAFNTSENSAIVCRDYGVILTKMEKFPEAELAFAEGIKRDPKEVLIHYNMGVLYFKAGRLTDAEHHLQQELKIDSTNNPMTWHVLGVICKQTGRMDQAAEMWKKALRVSPGFQPSNEALKSQIPSSKSQAPK